MSHCSAATRSTLHCRPNPLAVFKKFCDHPHASVGQLTGVGLGDATVARVEPDVGKHITYYAEFSAAGRG
jgi:hypothetical protein